MFQHQLLVQQLNLLEVVAELTLMLTQDNLVLEEHIQVETQHSLKR